MSHEIEKVETKGGSLGILHPRIRSWMRVEQDVAAVFNRHAPWNHGRGGCKPPSRLVYPGLKSGALIPCAFSTEDVYKTQGIALGWLW